MRHRRTGLAVGSKEDEKGSRRSSSNTEIKTIKGAAASGSLPLLLFLACSLLLGWGLYYSTRHSASSSQITSSSHLQLLIPIQFPSDTYNVFDCPDHPPTGYPREYPILQVLDHWKTNQKEPRDNFIYQGICVFDVASPSADAAKRVLQQIQNYRTAQVPFVVRGDAAVQRAVQKWDTPNYLVNKLAHKRFQVTLSNQTIMTYFSLDKEYNEIPNDYVPRTHNAPMSFEEWYSSNVVRNKPKTSSTTNGIEYAHMRLDACLDGKKCDSTYRNNPQHIDNADFIYQDLYFFYPGQSPYYDIDANKSRGIQCRADAGAPLLTAECHFDNERNYIAMMCGRRRYILAHPRSCPSLALYPQKHPLERHTQIDWRSLPEEEYSVLQNFPNFSQSTVNEVVLQPGDVLFLPTYWFHHIVSLGDYNIQCNTRSGYSVEYDQTIYDCGFFYDFPD